MSKRKTKQDYQDLALTKGLVWLGSEVVNNHTKTPWKCSKDHIWEAIYHNIRQGHDCPYCAGKARLTKNKFHDIAKERGFSWVGVEAVTCMSDTNWQCSEGHQWKARYNTIQQGCGCPYCAKKAPKTSSDYKNLAAVRNLIWLGPEVDSIRLKTGWQCPKGHQWKTQYSHIQQGHGCPRCAKQISKPEIQLREAIKVIYPDTVGNIKGLLKSQRLELDIYVPSLRKAIEYDGWSHTFFEDQWQRDQRKNIECVEADIQLLRVKHKDYERDSAIVTAMALDWLNTATNGG